MSLRVMLSSNLINAPTGYGVQAGHLLPRLRDQLGHEVAQFAWWGLKGSQMAMDGIPIYPAFEDAYGNDCTGAHAKHFGADLIVTLIDVWVFQKGFHASLGGIPWAPWAPVDSVPAAIPTVERMREAEYPLQYSQFGMREMQRAGIECTYIPHGCETQNVFVPGDKRAARTALGLPQEAFICAMVAANKGAYSRKAFAEQLTAFARFRQRHPDAVLYLHTRLTPATRDSVRLDLLCQSLGLGENVVYWPDQYQYQLGIPEEGVAQVYQAADVLLGATCAEGFGIPLIEAQACHCPVISTDFSAMPELTVNGIAVKPVQLQWAPLAVWQAVPSIAGITEALTEIYRWGGMKRQRNAETGRAFVVERFDWSVTVERDWRPFLERVEADRAAGTPTAPQLVEVGA